MADFTMTDPVLELQRHLLGETPALQRWLDAACEEHEETPQSEYWLFSYVVRSAGGTWWKRSWPLIITGMECNDLHP